MSADISQPNALDHVMPHQAPMNDPWTSCTLNADSSFSASDILRPPEPQSTDVHLHAEHGSVNPSCLG